MADRAERVAREFIDKALETQRRLGYKDVVPKKSYERAVKQAAEVLGTLETAEGKKGAS